MIPSEEKMKEKKNKKNIERTKKKKLLIHTNFIPCTIRDFIRIV